MTAALGVTTSGSALWFLSRGTGIASLGLLTLVMVLGVLTRGGVPLPGTPRFVTVGLHRNATLLALSLLVIHIVTAVADPYAPIRIVDTLVPFLSPYRPLWLGLGALAFDLLLAVVVSSLLRLRIGVRIFRGVHWAAYAVWPVALVHGLGTGSDVHTSWMLWFAASCVVAVLWAVLWRLARRTDVEPGRRKAIGTAVLVAPLALVAWMQVGPLAPHWATRSGTPAALIHGGSTATASTVAAAGVVSGSVHGSLREQVDSGQATVVLSGNVTGIQPERLQIVLRGTPSGGGVSLSSGSVQIAPAGGAVYTGPVTGLNGGAVYARLSGPTGVVRVLVDVQPDAEAGTFDGTVRLQ